MDLRLEAAAAAEFAENCADDEGFRIPAVDWRRTGPRVVTFERVSGLPVIDRMVLRDAGHDPDRILERAATVFFNQVFRDGFFHADMHPGNMLVGPRGEIVALDFGIMGRLEPATRRQLAEMLLGFLTRDYGRVTDVFFRAGFLPPDQDREGFRQAVPRHRRADPRPAAERDLDGPPARPTPDSGAGRSRCGSGPTSSSCRRR